MSDDPIVTAGEITFWLKTNLKRVNVELGTSFSIIENTLIIDPVPTPAEKEIFIKMYMIHFYELKINDLLVNDSGMAVAAEGGVKIELVDTNSIVKRYSILKDREIKDLNKMIINYKRNKYAPKSVGELP